MIPQYENPLIGEKLQLLLEDSRKWVNRRVDSLRLDADGTTRRFVSLDMTIPPDLKCVGSLGRIIVPLGILKKGTTQRFDTSYEGKSIPVLGRKDNAQIVANLLYSSLPNILRNSEVSEYSTKKLFYSIASCGLGEDRDALGRYEAWLERTLSGMETFPEEDKEIEKFNNTVLQMIENFILLVEVDESALGCRSIMKYALDQEEPAAMYPGTRRLVMAQPVPDLGFSASYHIEFEVPGGLTVDKIHLAELIGEDDSQSDRIAVAYSTGRVAHVNIEPSSPSAVGFIRVEISVAKQGLLSFTKWTLFAVLSCVVLAFVVRSDVKFFIDGKVQIPSPAASILLIGPALLVSWISRSPEHPMLAKMLSPLRHMLMWAVVSLILMAALAAIKVQPLIWSSVWWGLLVIAVLNVSRFLAFRFNWRVPRWLQLSKYRKFTFGVPYKDDEELGVQRNGTANQDSV